VAEDHGRAVAGDFDQIFGCVRTRGFKESDYYLIDIGLKGCERRAMGFEARVIEDLASDL
jgi:hypothetical protein